MAGITSINSAVFKKGIIGTDPILTDGVPQIVFVGRSNVGKSSVVNSLTNRKDLVKVSNKPGKTTELNFFSINNGKAYFVDLPGYGYAEASPKQKEKLEKLILWYLMYSGARPRMVVLILDMKAGLTAFDEEMIRVLREHEHPYLVVANKADKLNQKESSAQLRAIQAAAHEATVATYSATTATPKERATLLQKILED
ncbi:MAG: ribosome biogenesis GTP-binding protein YihA/YsxC [Candidatus Pacebacteria bacterium]|nr:ribosome biogenesis GTP-binding protein YihA/YsxC [Candidatus Paceibacterota bacterium]